MAGLGSPPTNIHAVRARAGAYIGCAPRRLLPIAGRVNLRLDLALHLLHVFSRFSLTPCLAATWLARPRGRAATVFPSEIAGSRLVGTYAIAGRRAPPLSPPRARAPQSDVP